MNNTEPEVTPTVLPQSEFGQTISPTGSELSRREKSDAALIHVVGFCSFIIPGGVIVAAIIFFLIRKRFSSFIQFHFKASLNFQITLFLAILILSIGFKYLFSFLFTLFESHWSAVALFYYILLLGPLMLMVHAFSLTFTCIAFSKAKEGFKYRYPLSLKII